MELSRLRPEVPRAKAAIVATLLLLPLSVGGQSSPPFPKGVPKCFQLSRYVNQALAFELSYPSSYRHSDSPVPSPPSYRQQWQALLHATTGSGQARCEDRGECDKFGRMIIALDRRPFDLQTIVKYYAQTGWDQPETYRLGAKTFYYVGTGAAG